ncbi:MAG: DivIVA domain-containing protein [Bacilli bacterium]|nr:DivIVA domain-containing protein [Bacilli bacterium]
MEKFNYEPNGYNRKEVNQFISDVIDQTSGIVKKYSEQKETIQQQQREIENLKVELQHYRKIENDIKESLLRAENNAREIKSLASQERDMIIRDAKNSASRIVNEALIKSEELETRTMLAAKNLKIFKQKLNIIIEQQKAIVDEIDEIEII